MKKCKDELVEVLNRPNGWHYDLDHIWILRSLESIDLPKGATILDAGAGMSCSSFWLLEDIMLFRSTSQNETFLNRGKKL